MSEHKDSAGHPMDEIARKFKTKPNFSLGDPLPARPVSPSDQHPSAENRAVEIEPVPSAEPTFGPLSLSADQIAGPAFFVDPQLSIRWIAPDTADAFSQALGQEWAFESTSNIFTLLLKPSVKETIPRWQTFFSFVYVLLRRSTPRDQFDRETVSVATRHSPSTACDTSRLPECYPFQVESCSLVGHHGNTEAPLRLSGVTFREGTLFLIRQDPWPTEPAGDRAAASPVGPVESMDEKKTVCLLSARINNSHRIADAMLPEVFFQLIHRIWNEADGVVRSLGGTRAASNGAEIQYMFTRNAGRNPIFSAITCATRLNGSIRTLQEKLNAEEGLTDEICMNIGISHGTGELTTPDPAGSMDLMIPGGAADQSALLSAIAEKGEIWITKNAIGQLPKQLIDQVVLGVHRQGHFVRNFFTRLSDLSERVGMHHPRGDMGDLPITRIVKIETKKSVQPITNEV